MDHEVEFRWKETIIYWEGLHGFVFDGGWGVRPPITYVPDETRWDEVVPGWMQGRRIEIVGRLRAHPGHVVKEVLKGGALSAAVRSGGTRSRRGTASRLVRDYGQMLTDTRLREVAERLLEVSGVEAVMLGGSRARGAETPDSDVDLGLYYREPLDVAGLTALAGALAEVRSGSGAPKVTAPGAWGPWVDGGGWLAIDGMPVDWIYRKIDRVQRSWELAQRGVFSFHFQVGHPLGIPDFAYAGEVALGVVLADPDGELTRLKEQATTYPPALTRAVLDRLNEAEFILGTLPKSAQRGDVAFVAGSLFRVVGLCAHAVHAKAGRWVISEKGLIDATDQLPEAPTHFAERARAVVGQLGIEPADLVTAISSARSLVAEVIAA